MSKTLKTKKRIVGLLKKKQMTISGLSQELGLSSATVSQHIDELQRTGVVEKVENEHFKKLKYYRVGEISQPIVANYAKYIIGAIIVIALASVALYSYNGARTSPSAPKSNPHVAVVSALTTGLACPMSFYSLNASIENYSGFSLYNINTSIGNVSDYVIGNGQTGKLYVAENISNVLQEPANSSILNRTHYIVLYSIGNGTNSSQGAIEQLNYTISPQNYTAKNNTTVDFEISIYTNSTEAKGTYWLRIEGPCYGISPVLVTVGTAPYNGTVAQAPLITS